MQAVKNRFALVWPVNLFRAYGSRCVENSKSSASSKASIWCTSPGGTSTHCPASIFKFFDYLVARDPCGEKTTQSSTYDSAVSNAYHDGFPGSCRSTGAYWLSKLPCPTLLVRYVSVGAVRPCLTPQTFIKKLPARRLWPSGRGGACLKFLRQRSGPRVDGTLK
jgi:hypothetical protein